MKKTIIGIAIVAVLAFWAMGNYNKMVTEEDMRFVLGKCCYGNGHEKLIADFYNCIRCGKPFSIDGEEASKVVKMIFAAYRSNGEKINIEG